MGKKSLAPQVVGLWVGVEWLACLWMSWDDSNSAGGQELLSLAFLDRIHIHLPI